jgi:hypothetical protein
MKKRHIALTLNSMSIQANPLSACGVSAFYGAKISMKILIY